jgi:HlyD family secretion protein
MRASLKRFAVLSALSLAGAGAALAQTPPVKAGPLPPSVTVASADEREIVERAVVTGTLVPRDEVLVAPEIVGLRITEVLVEEGAVVKQGQVLARLSRDILETQLAQNTASLSRADAAIAQGQKPDRSGRCRAGRGQRGARAHPGAHAGGNTTDAVLEQRVSAARVGEGRLARRATRFAWRGRQGRHPGAAPGDSGPASPHRNQAPAPGIVLAQERAPRRERHAVGEPLFRIIANGEIELEGEVTELQLARIRKGAPARIGGDSGSLIEGRVRNVFPEVDRATRLGKVRIALPKDAALHIGSFARGTVEIARRTGGRGACRLGGVWRRRRDRARGCRGPGAGAARPARTFGRRLRARS